jgi:hypothetical protein
VILATGFERQAYSVFKRLRSATLSDEKIDNMRQPYDENLDRRQGPTHTCGGIDELAEGIANGTESFMQALGEYQDEIKECICQIKG